MVKKKDHYLNTPPDPKIDRAPRHVVRREFAKRLSGLLRAKRWNQSDLARAMYGETTESRTGKRVARGRDNVSGWIRGEVLPSDREMANLCHALEVDRGELVPYELVPNVDKDFGPFEAKQRIQPATVTEGGHLRFALGADQCPAPNHRCPGSLGGTESLLPITTSPAKTDAQVARDAFLWVRARLKKPRRASRRS
jgi:hypothetical protein